MMNFPMLLETSEPAASGSAAGLGAPGLSVPAGRGLLAAGLFLEVLDAHLARRRAQEDEAREAAERKRAAQPRDDQSPRSGDAAANARPRDFSMYKLYLSHLLRMGGPAPAATPESTASSASVREALKVWRSGSHRAFARDSDLFSAPRFPITRFKDPA